MRLNKKNTGFTLIELMIVFTIMILLSISIYAPYSYYSNKAKLKVAKSEIAKTIYEARNMAIYGLDDGSSNKSVGAYFDKNNKNSIKLYSYPYNFTGPKNDFSSADVDLIKEIKLQPGIQINKIGGKDNALFYFQAISGTGSYYYFTPSSNTFSNSKIDIKFSYKNGGPNLQSKIEYFTKTNIVDY